MHQRRALCASLLVLRPAEFPNHFLSFLHFPHSQLRPYGILWTGHIRGELIPD